MFPLFELVRLLSIKNEHDRGKSPLITRCTWKEAGEINLLALSCNNGFLLLRYSNGGKDATIKHIPWPSDRPISALCLDPTVTWLLVVTEDCTHFIIPARSIMDPDAKVNQLWKVDDVTITKVKKTKGTPTFAIWWHTLSDEQVAIMGTKSGEIIFIDLLKRNIVHETQVDAVIVNFDLIQDDNQMTTHLLITGQAGIQWKMLLESRTHEVLTLQEKEAKELNELGYDQIDGRQLPVFCVTVATDMKHLFFPMRFYQFQRSVALSPQNARGRHFIAAHDNKSSTYQIFDSNIEHLPLFVYKLPTGSYNIILSDKVIHTMTRLSGEKRLLILANLMAETSIEDTKEFNKDSVLQQFDLPQDERLLAVVPKSFPFYWHEKHEEEIKQSLQLSHSESLLSGLHQSDYSQVESDVSHGSYEIEVPSHTVLNGCLIVTDAGVYECRPRISPERLFLDLCIQQKEPSVTDSLGISLGLDIQTLYERAAEYCVKNGQYSHASKLFKLSKCKFVKRVSCFAKHGRVTEVLSLLKQVMTLPGSEVTVADKKKMADLAVHCYIYQAKLNAPDCESETILKDFLTSNFLYNETQALTLLAENGMIEIVLELAKTRGLVLEALNLLASYNHFILTPSIVRGLLAKGFTTHLLQAAEGVFIQFLSPTLLVELLCHKEHLAFQHYQLLQAVLFDLTENDLEKLTMTFDPSRPSLKCLITNKMVARRRTGSLSSLTSIASETDTLFTEPTIPETSKLIEFFVAVLLQLNRIREKAGHVPNIKELLCTDHKEVHRQVPESRPEVKKQKLSCRPCPIGAGHQHVAMVRNGDLYTWGRNSNGRLGHGDLALDNTVSPPCRVETLHMLQIKVISVSCGGEHTVALTQQGVYAWGSSWYGQVGVGTTHTYSRPMFIDALSATPCVQVSCGQYHTLALTVDAEVYSWGWNVHGQLGLGSIEDALIPTKITALSDKQVIKVTAGYCHTLVLTALGKVWGFGCGFFGQLGLGHNSKYTSPILIETIKDKIVEIATKYFHNVAISAQNRVFSWGCHPFGLRFVAHAARKARQAGRFLGDPVERYLLPEEVDTCYVNGRIKQAVCGSSHSCLITIDGDVYTWGRNLEGQLGNNSKQEGRLPNMVTSINDRQVKHMVSGGEYNIVMDTDGLVWVWGKNEYGQLGLEKTDMTSSHSYHIRVSGRHQNNGSTSTSEILLPTVCPGLPPTKPKSVLHQASFSKSDSFDSSDGDIWFSGGSTEDRHLELLPDLQTLGDIKYGRMVLLHVLEHLSDFCNCVQILRKCTNIGDYLSAVYVCVHKQDYAQALVYHLKALKKYRNHYEEKFTAIASAITNHYLQLCVNQDISAMQKEENYRIILLKVLSFWEEERLKTEDLEILLSTYIDSLCCILSVLLFWPQRTHDQHKKQEDADEKVGSQVFITTSQQTLQQPVSPVDSEVTTPINQEAIEEGTVHSKTDAMYISESFQSSFSTKFTLDVLQRVVDRVLSLDFEKKHPVTYSSLKPLLQSRPETKTLDLQPSDKLISYDQLWQDVVQNLQKGCEARDFIYVTRSEVDHLDEKLQDQVSYSDKPTPSCAVMFTCGHYYSKKAFMEEVQIRISREMSQGVSRLPETANILVRYYNRQGLLPLACPKCVLNAVQSIKA